mmetsp:Transcript_12559/g.52829  ORF Transcript_12559/g.52829 Transcript_12559/m.52829 type:complete len:260 (+) Transcript_12559:3236-4015(+)
MRMQLLASEPNELVHPGQDRQARELVGAVRTRHQNLRHAAVGALPPRRAHLREKLAKCGVGLLADLPVSIAEHVKQAVEELGKELEHIDVGRAVQHGDPANQQLPHERIGNLQALAQQRDEGVDLEVFRIGHNVLDQAVEQVRSVLHVGVSVRRQPAECVEDAREVTRHCRVAKLRHVVERLARIVAHARVGVVKRVQDGWHNDRQVRIRVGRKRHGRRREAQQAALAAVRQRARRELCAGERADEAAHTPLFTRGRRG